MKERNELLMHMTPQINHIATMKKKSSKKRIDPVWFYSNTISENGNSSIMAKKISGCLAMVQVGQEGLITKGHKKTIRGNGYIHYFDRGDCFHGYECVGVCVYIHTYIMYAKSYQIAHLYKVYCMSITPQ